MAYYVLHRDLKKDRRAIDLSKIDTFVKDVVRKAQEAEQRRKQN